MAATVAGRDRSDNTRSEAPAIELTDDHAGRRHLEARRAALRPMRQVRELEASGNVTADGAMWQAHHLAVTEPPGTMSDTQGPTVPTSRVAFVVRRGADLGADVDDLLVVYAAATSPSGEDMRDRAHIMRRHATHPDAVGVVALADDHLVGFAYGTRSRRGQSWHDHVSAALAPAQRDLWLRDAFVLCELAVLPAEQGQGIGRELVQRLLRRPEADRRRTVLLSAAMDNPVDRLYRSVGFDDLIVDLPFHPDGPRFRVMGRERREA